MPRKKLSARTKKQIKENFRKLKKKDFSGEALVYLNRVKGAAKARAAKKAQEVYVAAHKLPKDSYAWRIIAGAAKNLGLTPAQAIKKNPELVGQFIKNQRFTLYREVDALIADIRRLEKHINVYVKNHTMKKHVKTARGRAEMYLTRLKTHMLEIIENIYDKILIKHFYDGSGNLYFEIPYPEMYEDINDSDSLRYFIDKYYAKKIIYYIEGES